MATPAELQAPSAAQASGSAVPEALAQKPTTAPNAAVQKPEVRQEERSQQPARRLETAVPVAASTGEMVTLNFDDADIYEVVNAMSDLLGVNFIIDQRVKGRVNIHTAGEVDKSRVLPIMETIFEMNNIAMVKYDDFYKIIPIKEAKQQVADFSIGRDIAKVPSYDRQMIQIVPLQYVPAKEIETLVKRFLGPGGDVFEYPKGNIVVIIERAATIRKMLRLINEVDIDLFAYNHVRFFKVENANAVDVAAELEEIFLSIGIEKTPEKGLGMKFIPVERVGGVLAVSSIPAAFDRVQKWLDVLDTVDKDASEQVFIYFVENGKAEEIGDVLNQVYLGGSSGGGMMGGQDYQSRTRGGLGSSSRSGLSGSSSRSGLSGSSSSSSGLSGSSSSSSRSGLSGSGSSFGSGGSGSSRNRGSNRRSQMGGRGMSSQGGQASTLLEADAAIVVDIPTNAIIVRAIARDYEIIKRTMIELDKIPRQVLIEVLIAEVALSGDTEFGVEWALLSDGSIGGYDGQELIGVKNTRLRDDIPVDFTEALGGGFNYLFDADELKVFIQAQASQNKLKILSSPHILAVDNMEARIEVGEEVPLITSEYQPLDVDSDTQTSRSIEYRSTGVILSVTPRINERGLVAMDISQEVSKAKLNVSSTIESPIITNRIAETSLVVQDGQTIVIGGLIQESGESTESGVPYLSAIPLIGWLFGTTKSADSKTELILFLTPHVVANFEEVDLVTKEMKSKLGNIRSLINKSDEYWDAYKDEE
jgi:general secretion pathway protein D